MRQHQNPHFPLTRRQAADFLRVELPKVTLRRPLVIIGGYRGPKFSIQPIYGRLAPRISNPEQILMIASPWCASLQAAKTRALAAARERFAHAGEVDIIGHSMGGLVARLLLNEPTFPSVRRLFTLATPHRGAVMASWFRPDPAAGAMRPGSSFLQELNGSSPPRPTEIHCYARLGDWWVGARNCAPPGEGSYWLDADTTLARLAGHFTITRDVRILADVLARLDDSVPFSRQPSDPPRN